jgi:hypothetical protein
MWNNPDDKNPIVFSSHDPGFALSIHKDTVFIGTENNCVESIPLPSGEPRETVAKFTAGVNHVDVSKSGNILVAGSG